MGQDPRTRHVTFLCLSFLVSKKRVIVSSSQGRVQLLLNSKHTCTYTYIFVDINGHNVPFLV